MSESGDASVAGFSFVEREDIADPLAANLGWDSLPAARKRINGVYRGYRIQQVTDRRLEVKPSWQSYAVFIGMVAIFIGLSVMVIVGLINAIWGAVALAGFMALIFAYVIHQQLRNWRRSIVLDRAGGITGAVLEDAEGAGESIPMHQVHALQVLDPELLAIALSSEVGRRQWFEIYLVLADGRRAFLFSNAGNYKVIYRDIEMLSRFLGVPVWGHFPRFAASARSFVRGLKWFFLAIFFIPIIMMMTSFMDEDSWETVESGIGPMLDTAPFDGTFSTDFGELRLLAVQSAGGDSPFSLSGLYEAGDGAITGDADLDTDGRTATIHGVWWQGSAERRCDVPMNGTHYWGRFEWQMQAGAARNDAVASRFDSFAGTWTYCDDDPAGDSVSGNWSGQRVRDSAGLGYCDAPAQSMVYRAGCAGP